MWPFKRSVRKPAPSASKVPKVPETLAREAAANPGGWVYAIDERIADPMGDVPFFAIKGWHRVDAQGQVEGEFSDNEKYDREATTAWIEERKAPAAET